MTVARRLANGNLVVRGQKWIEINQGREFMRIQGVIRPIDILPDNSIPSYKVADASISYGAQGCAGRCQSSRACCPASSIRSSTRCENAHRTELFAVAALAMVCWVLPPRRAERVKDLASVSGVRGNQLVGYGLVIGPGWHRRPDQPGAVHRPEHQEHAGAASA